MVIKTRPRNNNRKKTKKKQFNYICHLIQILCLHHTMTAITFTVFLFSFFGMRKIFQEQLKSVFCFILFFMNTFILKSVFFFSISLSKRKLDTVFVIVRILIVAFTLTTPKQITGSTSEGINSTKRTKKVQNFLLHKNMLFSHHLRNMSN